MTTVLIGMYNWFEIFSSNNVLTILDRYSYFSCPKIGQNPTPISVTCHMDNTLSIDIRFMNKVAFIMTISRKKLKFITSKYIPSRRKRVILAAIQQTNNTYSHRGFCITDYNSDNWFKPIQYGNT